MSSLVRSPNLATGKERPRFGGFVLGIIALLIAILAQKQLYSHQITNAAVLYGLALFCFLLPFHRHFSPRLAVAVRLGGSARWATMLAMIPAIGAIGLAYWGITQFQANIKEPTQEAWLAYIASVLLFILFAWLLDLGITPGVYRGSKKMPWRRIEIGAAFAICAIAIFMRLWHFDSIPFGVWYDEAVNGLQALRILDGDGFYPLFVSAIHAPAHYLYLIAALFHYGEISVQSIRLVSVFMGLATVWAAYLAGREFFGRSLGLAAAFIVAVARWNVNFSRIGMYNASTPLFELLAVAFLLRGIRRGRYLDYGLAGLWLGLGFCFYAAFQIFIAAILLYLLLLIIFQRGFRQRTWSGILLMFGTAFLVIAPVLLFAYTNPELYFERTQDTSIFADKTPVDDVPDWLATRCVELEAPWSDRCERLPRLFDNTRKHLLMFNYQGDPNGRHNLPGEPMLDNILAALLVLGVGVALLRFWHPQPLLLLLWFGAMLMGGILSLGFEAPQSLRAIGTQPASYLLALIPLHALQQAWHRSGGKRYAQFYTIPLVLLLLWIGIDNYITYFHRQATNFASWNAFSTPETIAANLLKTMDDNTEPFLISYFHDQPTIKFLTENQHPYRRIETTDHLPMDWQAGKDIAIIANADSRTLYDEAKQYYPNGTFEEFRAPDDGPTVVYYAKVSAADIVATQGIVGRYYSGDNWEGAPLLETRDGNLNYTWPHDAPVAAPFSVEWEGVLNVHDYGTHQFFLQSPGQSALYLNESSVLTGTGELSGALVLAEGKHRIRVRATSGDGLFRLGWRPPASGPEIIPPTALFVPPITSNGLLARFYANGNWEGTEVLARIDPRLNQYFHNPPLLRPYTVEWTGKLAIPQSGLYHFGIESIDESVLYINEQQITSSPLPNQYQEGSVELTQGLHDIRIRYADRTDHTHINVYWIPPFAGQQSIPPELLFPPQENYDRMTMPALSQLAFQPEQPPTATGSAALLAGNVRLVAGGFASPKGVAVGPNQQIYVADTGNRRVVVVSADGEILGELEPAEPYQEPFDLVVNRAGEIFVLDPQAQRIDRFAADRTYLGTVPIGTEIVSRARGIGIDQADHLWIAHTPAGQVTQLTGSGEVLQTIPVWPGEDSQPVDVAIGRDGSIFVTDSGLHKLVRFDGNGRRLLAWDLPVANSIDGSHLAVSETGYLHISKPEPFLIAQHTPEGEPIGDWSVMSANGNVVKPVGIAVDFLGQIWFVDTAGGALYVIEVDAG